MARRSFITQPRLINALKALKAAGLSARSVEINHATGQIVIIPKTSEADDLSPEQTALERWRASRGKSAN